MAKKAISFALVFTLISAFIPMPAKAQFEPPVGVERDFDPLGRLTRVSFVNPNSGVRETMTLAYGETFEAQTFSTVDGILVLATANITRSEGKITPC